MIPAELERMLSEQCVYTPSGEVRALHSAIWPEDAKALHDLVLERAPTTVLEIGMAYGASSLAIASALEERGSGSLISVDPSQSTDWESIGMEALRRANLVHRHTLLEEPDFVALPRMLSEGLSFDLVYIDGWHTFDYTLLDLFYADKLLSVGGVVGINDSGFVAVGKALAWFTSHRRYEELDVGLPTRLGPPIHGSSTLSRKVLRKVGRPGLRYVSRIAPSLAVGPFFARFEDRYFEKCEVWEPPGVFYASF
jgi:predicted O-methyltransferase YrrM